jgi:hypothetical protein
MGRLTLELMKQTAPGSHGCFRLVNRAMIEADGFESFSSWADALTKKFPLQLAGEPAPRLHEGMVCLNDPAAAQARLAVFQVARRGDAFQFS